MKRRVDIKRIRVQWLNATSLNLVAKYAKLAFYVDETRIQMSSDTCLKEVVEHARRTHNPTLKATYRELKQELRKLLSHEDLQPKLDALIDYRRPKSDNQDKSKSRL